MRPPLLIFIQRHEHVGRKLNTSAKSKAEIQGSTSSEMQKHQIHELEQLAILLLLQHNVSFGLAMSRNCSPQA